MRISHSHVTSRKHFAAVLFTITTVLLFTPCSNSQDFPGTINLRKNLRRTAVVDVVEKNRDVVVNIHSERTLGLKNKGAIPEVQTAQQRVNGMGTGVVIDPRGFILTNNHVVDDVQSLRIRLADGTSLAARVITKDAAEDLAIIKVDPPHPLPLPSYGTATDLMPGETVIAIGNAFGYEHTVTCGVVSAIKRDVSLNREIFYKSLIQTDASINPGNSGGPLFNIHGELVGINVAIRAGAQGIGFAIPVDNALRVAAELLAGRKSNSRHGLVLRDNFDASTNPIRRWSQVESVEPNSNADKAGIKSGDIIEKIADTRITSALDVERAFLDRSNNDKIPFLIRRNASAHAEGGNEVKVTFVRQATVPVAIVPSNEVIWKRLGIRVAPVTADQVVKVNSQLHGGLMIMEVAQDSLASKAGFQRGDILIGLHQWETISYENITYVLNHPDLASFAPLKYFLIHANQLKRGWLGISE